MMKCITLCPPWAWGMTVGPKDLENRSWPTKYRGELLIHSGKSRDWFNEEALETLDEYDVPTRFEAHSPGCIVGIVTLADCWSIGHALTMRLGVSRKFAWGPWCHVYTNRRWFERPIPYRGAQGLFNVPTDLPRLSIEIERARPAIWTPDGRKAAS